MLLAAMLLAASPVPLSPAEAALIRQVAPCRMSLIYQLLGDKDYLGRYLKGKPPAEAAHVRAICVVYLQGGVDVLDIQRAENRARK